MAVRTRNLNATRRLCSVRSERLASALKRRDGQGHTLMHWAAKAGDVEMLELLAGTRCFGVPSVLYNVLIFVQKRSLFCRTCWYSTAVLNTFGGDFCTETVLILPDVLV